MFAKIQKNITETFAKGASFRNKLVNSIRYNRTLSQTQIHTTDPNLELPYLPVF